MTVLSVGFRLLFLRNVTEAPEEGFGQIPIWVNGVEIGYTLLWMDTTLQTNERVLNLNPIGGLEGNTAIPSSIY